MKRKTTSALATIAMLIVLLTTSAFALIDSFNYEEMWDVETGKDFPLKYVDVGLYKGENGVPSFDGKNVIALYDPVDMDGGGRGVTWLGYWDSEKQRNKEVHEIDNPVFLIAEYENEQLVGLRESTEEEIERLTASTPSSADNLREIVMFDHIVEAALAYSSDHLPSLLRAADEKYGEFLSIAAPREQEKSIYLLTQYEGEEFIGFKELTKEEYETITKTTISDED